MGSRVAQPGNTGSDNGGKDNTGRDAQVEGVLVEIFGEKYRIGGDPKQVQQVAAYVDSKMKEIATKNGRMPKAQVAMLAAMEVAADLFKVMSERRVFTERAHESVERLTRLVEDRAGLAGAGHDTHSHTHSDRQLDHQVPDAAHVPAGGHRTSRLLSDATEPTSGNRLSANRASGNRVAEQVRASESTPSE